MQHQKAGQEDIFNNEAMENPPDDVSNNVNKEDVTVRFKMPAQRGSPDTSDPARFYVPAQNPGCINRVENVTSGGSGGNGYEEGIEKMDDSEPEPGHEYESGAEQNNMKNIIIVECQKLNGILFNGTINFSEAKIKIFKDGLGLDTALLATVRISFNLSLNSFKIKCKSLLLT